MKANKCNKCGKLLNKGEAKYCIYCDKSITPQEQQDIDDWKREESDW